MLTGEADWTIDEDASDTDVVDTIDTMVDPDAGDTDAYEILSETPDHGIFAIDNDGVVTVGDNTNLDFETQETYTLDIQVTDSGPLTDHDDFIITVGDVEESTCGNGTVEGAEECDDSGTDPGDGCGASCRVESGWACTGEPSVCTQDVNYLSHPDLSETIRSGGCCPRSDVR